MRLRAAARKLVSAPVRRWAGLVVVALAGAAVGLALGGSVTHDVGPFAARISVIPSWHGGIAVHVPPLGDLTSEAYDGPLRLKVELTQLRQAEAQRLLNDPAKLANIGDDAAADVQAAVIRLVIEAGIATILGSAVACMVVYRGRRESAIGAGLAVVLLAGVAGMGAATWSTKALTEPKYTGLLANSTTLVGDVRSVVTRFDVYRKELGGLITNTSKIYDAVSTAPTYEPDDSTIRVLHVSDLHLNPSAFNVINSVRKQFKVNFIVDTGDLTDYGTNPESSYVDQIAKLKTRYIFIRGNHDSAVTAGAVARQPNATVLQGTRPITVDGLTIIGTSDPRFTPDKDTRDDDASDQKVQFAGRRLASLLKRMKGKPDITMLHDPASAPPLKGKVPLILAGHLHHREVEQLGSTQVLVEGSTGGAGLRGLQGEKPTPLECSVLYFDAGTHKLEAYDDITLGGLGETEATIQRHVVVGGH
jgi:predicted MPP superfamily phosphohydrolase